MEIYAKSYVVKVWQVIKKGNYPVPTIAQPPTDPEDIDECTNEQMAVVQINAKVRNLLYNAINGDKYEKISSCDTTKEMWDKLEVTYEGTSKVKETHINMLVHDYELFQMKEGESIEEMFARFSKIISDVKAFGKPYSSGIKVRKILRSLPTTWQTKVVALESQDLNKLSYDELRGNLIAFEKTHLKKTSHEEKKKTVAFKATTERTENDIDDDPEALEKEITIVSTNMDGLMRRYRNTKRGRIPPRRTRQYNELDKNDGKCYECGRNGHVQAECLDLKRKVAGQMKMHQTMNANMIMRIVSWHEEILDLTLKESQKMMNGLRRLNKEKKDWELKLEVCEIEKEVLQDKVQELQIQLNDMRKSTSYSFVKSNQATYKSIGKGPARKKSTSTNTSGRSKNGSEHHRKSHKEKWYLDSACSSHMTCDKNLFKEVTNINGGSVKFGDDSKRKIVGTDTVSFNNNCDITEVYLWT
ncbi:uncharacterized protein [Nicotiana sylvestris]|uniref:Uncharacterized protein LOC104245798 n=1 Tax=Nicotiana sylvestris TaxID=4096 RepID=A0A1U7Y6L6_NICSY|nr:PREDICTED: uncharacterized protein LOC104245798 [Nicotiana sylvestris]